MRGVPMERTDVASRTAGDRCGVKACAGDAFVGVGFTGVAFVGGACCPEGGSGSAPAVPASCTRRTFAGGEPSSAPCSPGKSEEASFGNPPEGGFIKYLTKHCLLASSCPP